MSSNSNKTIDPAKERHINKIVFYVFIAICVVYACFYAWHTVKEAKKPKYSNQYKIGVVQTTDDENVSYITYYDKNMKKGYTQKIKNGSIGETNESPQIANKTVYMISNGTNASETDDKMISFNIQKGTKKTYPVGQTNISNFRVDKPNIYTAATVNNELVLHKYVKKDKKQASVSLKGYTLDCFKVYNKKLYVFVTPVDDKEGKKSELKIINTEKMEVESSVNLSAFPGHKTDLVLASTSIYFTYTPSDTAKDQKGGVGVYNLVSKKVESANLTVDSPDEIVLSGNKFIITSKKSKKVSVFDFVNGTTNTIDLPTVPLLSKTTTTYFYYMDEKNLYRYKLSDMTLDITAKVPIKSANGKKLHLSSFYVH